MRSLLTLLGLTVLLSSGIETANADEPLPPVIAETLMQTVLEGAKDTEVIVSHVTLAPNTSLPKHWHPGEEFVYLLEGSVTLSIEGQEDFVQTPGTLVKIPYKAVHWPLSGDDGATAIVFRVHHHGEPESVPVE